MSSKVEIQFPPRSKGGRNHKGDSRISKFDSKGVCNGGRLRGRRRGRGGRGGHHSSFKRHGPSNGWFHGVECSDFRRRFSGEEFYKAGINGRLYLFNKCNSDKDTCHIQKVQQCGKYDGNEIAPVPYSVEATGNDNSGGN